MHINTENVTFKRRPINLTIREDILVEAKELNLNASKAAEYGIINAVKEARAQEWLLNNKKAILAHNERIEKQGILLTPDWSK